MISKLLNLLFIKDESPMHRLMYRVVFKSASVVGLVELRPLSMHSWSRLSTVHKTVWRPRASVNIAAASVSSTRHRAGILVSSAAHERVVTTRNDTRRAPISLHIVLPAAAAAAMAAARSHLA